MGERQVVTRSRQIRLKFQCAAARVNRLRRVAVQHPAVAKVIQGVRGLGIEFDGALVLGTRALAAGQRLQHRAERVVRDGRRRRVIHGAVRVAKTEVRQAGIAPQARKGVMRAGVA